MSNRTDDEIEQVLIDIISAGFNRSLGALKTAGAVDTREKDKHYSGIGSKYYDIVTEQIVLTAKLAAPGLRRFLDGEVMDTPLDF